MYLWHAGERYTDVSVRSTHTQNTLTLSSYEALIHHHSDRSSPCPRMSCLGTLPLPEQFRIPYSPTESRDDLRCSHVMVRYNNWNREGRCRSRWPERNYLSPREQLCSIWILERDRYIWQSYMQVTTSHVGRDTWVNHERQRCHEDTRNDTQRVRSYRDQCNTDRYYQVLQ